jgi:type IV pilus assembly protein PilV
MKNSSIQNKNANQGFSLIELLVTLMISVIGLLGFVELQNRTQIANLEASQRTFATLIASNMAEAIKANPRVGKDCSFPSTLKVGTDSGNWNYSCWANPAGQHSIREWHKALTGSGEQINFGAQNVGGIKDGRGCIDYTPPQPAAGVLEKYTVSVAWQGFTKTAVVGFAGSCGFNSFGSDASHHRLVSFDIYGSSLSTACANPPTVNLVVNTATEDKTGTYELLDGQVMEIKGGGKFNGIIAVNAGGHLILAASTEIEAAVHIRDGAHYWISSTAVVFQGSLTMEGILHAGESSCGWAASVAT